jgi:hypothetical protein
MNGLVSKLRQKLCSIRVAHHPPARLWSRFQHKSLENQRGEIMNARINAWAAGAVAASLLSVAGAPANASPSVFHYAGELRAANGLPYTGSVDVAVRLFNAMTGGTLLWQQDELALSVQAGLAEIPLTGTALQAVFSTNSVVWAEFWVDGEMLEPRQRIVAVPYAAAAANAQTLGGRAPADFLSATEALPSAVLPTNGIAAVSNGALSNEFSNVTWTFAGGEQNILDAPEPGGVANVTTSETGDSYLTSLAINASYQLTFSSQIRIRIFPPASTGIGPITVFEGFRSNGTYNPVWTPGNTPALQPLVGQKVVGAWAIEIVDTDDNAAQGTVVGKLTAFSVAYDVVRSDHLSVNGRVDVSGDFNVTGNIKVTGAVQATGPVQGQLVGASFFCNVHGQAQGWQKYCASNVDWNTAPNVLNIASDGTITVTQGGYYRIHFYADQLTNCSGGQTQIAITPSAGTIRRWEFNGWATGTWMSNSAEQILRLQAGQSVFVDTYQSCAAGNGWAYHSGPTWSGLQITRVGNL